MAETTVKGFFEGLLDKLTQTGKGRRDELRLPVPHHRRRLERETGGREVAVAEGEAPSPKCTVTMAEADFLDLVSEVNGQTAFLTGS